MAHFNPKELDVMKVLWNHGPMKPAEIQRELPRTVKNAALRWELGTLVQKGHVARKKRGKAYFYQATIPRERALKKITQRLAEAFSGGSALAFIGELIESEGLSAEDMRELKRIASKKASRKAPGTKRGGKKGAKS